MSGAGTYADEAPCGRCEKPVTLDHDPPCPHGLVACPECGHEAVCRDCAHIAERVAAFEREAGEPHDLDAKGTPLGADIERDGGYHWDGGWVEVPRHG